MKFQPNRDYQATTDDDVQTPDILAEAIVQHYRPYGRVLEPCSGGGAFVRALKSYQHLGKKLQVDEFEISRGTDFLKQAAPVERYDWIVTNTPWSQIRAFLKQSMLFADNVVFLLTINHIWTKARLRDIREAGFEIKGILTVNTPPSFPQSGFQLGAVHLKASRWSIRTDYDVYLADASIPYGSLTPYRKRLREKDPLIPEAVAV